MSLWNSKLVKKYVNTLGMLMGYCDIRYMHPKEQTCKGWIKILETEYPNPLKALIYGDRSRIRKFT